MNTQTDNRPRCALADGSDLPTPEAIARNVNRLLCVRDATGVSANEITDVVLSTLGEWTVKSEDFDRAAMALLRLRVACKHKLPPGWYAQVKEECDAADAVLCPNSKAEPRASDSL